MATESGCQLTTELTPSAMETSLRTGEIQEKMHFLKMAWFQVSYNEFTKYDTRSSKNYSHYNICLD